MTAMEMTQLVMGSGILAGGLGMLKWSLAVERRIIRIELKTGVLA